MWFKCANEPGNEWTKIEWRFETWWGVLNRLRGLDYSGEWVCSMRCVAIYFHALSNTTFTKKISGFYNWYKIPLKCVSFRCLQKALTLLIKGSRDLLPNITMQRVLVVGVSLLVWDLPHKIPSRLSLKMCQVFHRRCSHQIVLKMIESVTHSCNTIELSFIFVLNSNDFDSL